MHGLAKDLKNTKNDKKEARRLALQLFWAGSLIGVLEADMLTQQTAAAHNNTGNAYNTAITKALMRSEAKKLKDFAAADSLRAEILQLGFELADNADGTFVLKPKNA
jgi:cysteinyl-tRNA synthetase